MFNNQVFKKEKIFWFVLFVDFLFLLHSSQGGLQNLSSNYVILLLEILLWFLMDLQILIKSPNLSKALFWSCLIRVHCPLLSLCQLQTFISLKVLFSFPPLSLCASWPSPWKTYPPTWPLCLVLSHILHVSTNITTSGNAFLEWTGGRG